MREVALPIGLADAELESYSRRDDTVLVTVRTWNERRLAITFHGVIGLRDVLAAEFSGLFEDAPASRQLLEQALAQAFEVVPTDHSYRVYSFVNLDGEPSLEIVSSSFQVDGG